jgi:hypothetical protein
MRTHTLRAERRRVRRLQPAILARSGRVEIGLMADARCWRVTTVPRERQALEVIAQELNAPEAQTKYR